MNTLEHKNLSRMELRFKYLEKCGCAIERLGGFLFANLTVGIENAII